MSKRRSYKSLVILGIIDVLADVERATIRKIANEIGCHSDSVRSRMKNLIDRRLVEESGKVTLSGVKRSPMTYRLHDRLRNPTYARLHLFR